MSVRVVNDELGFIYFLNLGKRDNVTLCVMVIQVTATGHIIM